VATPIKGVEDDGGADVHCRTAFQGDALVCVAAQP